MELITAEFVYILNSDERYLTTRLTVIVTSSPRNISLLKRLNNKFYTYPLLHPGIDGQLVSPPSQSEKQLQSSLHTGLVVVVSNAVVVAAVANYQKEGIVKQCRNDSNHRFKM